MTFGIKQINKDEKIQKHFGEIDVIEDMLERFSFTQKSGFHDGDYFSHILKESRDLINDIMNESLYDIGDKNFLVRLIVTAFGIVSEDVRTS